MPSIWAIRSVGGWALMGTASRCEWRCGGRGKGCRTGVVSPGGSSAVFLHAGKLDSGQLVFAHGIDVQQLGIRGHRMSAALTIHQVQNSKPVLCLHSRPLQHCGQRVLC